MRLIDADLPPEEVVREAIESPYTRLPLWRGDPDNIIGILHAKDLLRALVAAGGDASKLKIAEHRARTLVRAGIDDACATSFRPSCAARRIRRWSSTNTASSRAS